MVKLFGISGSPRIAATDWIIQEALRYIEEKWNAETRYFSVRGKKLKVLSRVEEIENVVKSRWIKPKYTPLNVLSGAT